MSFNPKIRSDIKNMLERVIKSGGARKRRGGYEKDDDYMGGKRKTKRKGGIRAGMRAGLKAGAKKKKSGTSPWISHVKKYAKSHGMTYGEALSDPAVSSSYKKKKK
jgi:hypothetical protein